LLEFEKSRESSIIVLSSQALEAEMDNIWNASDYFVFDTMIYFVYKSTSDLKSHVDIYNIETNTHERISMEESVNKLLCFENEYFYWRTQLGG
jgi:hypothetical protein